MARTRTGWDLEKTPRAVGAETHRVPKDGSLFFFFFFFFFFRAALRVAARTDCSGTAGYERSQGLVEAGVDMIVD